MLQLRILITRIWNKSKAIEVNLSPIITLSNDFTQAFHFHSAIYIDYSSVVQMMTLIIEMTEYSK